MLYSTNYYKIIKKTNKFRKKALFNKNKNNKYSFFINIIADFGFSVSYHKKKKNFFNIYITKKIP
jgi:hypothetical protein